MAGRLLLGGAHLRPEKTYFTRIIICSQYFVGAEMGGYWAHSAQTPTNCLLAQSCAHVSCCVSSSPPTPSNSSLCQHSSKSMSSTVRLLVSALQRKWKWPAARPHPLSRTHRDFSAKHSPENSDASQQSSLIDPPLLSPVQTCLALSVHFLHPKLGMKDYEILSRATAFLLNVDPLEEQIYSPDDISDALNNKNGTQTTGRQTKSAFPHLASNQSKRDAMAHKQDYAFEPAAGPKRHAHELNWLEFTPPNFRPRVHVMASSHVLSPWMWPQYYGQDWLKMVEQEHVRYSLEVYGCKENGGSVQEGKLDGKFEPIAKFALNPYPIHHPNGLDVAVIHLKGEDEGESACGSSSVLLILCSLFLVLKNILI